MTAPKRRRDEELTLPEAAAVLGVHYMTAYRYVRTGRLVATQTGSEWRVRRSSIAALQQPAPPGRPKRGTAPKRHNYERRLCDRLVQGDEAEAWRVTQQALASACTPEDLYLEVLGPAMRRVGDEWEAGRLTVADEHRASTLMYRLIGRLGPLLTHRGRTRGVVVLGALEHDNHGLPTALVADVLRGRGFTVADLGANTPAESFRDTIAATKRLVATGIVATSTFDDPVAVATIDAIRAATAKPVVIGGGAIRDEHHAHALGADAGTTTARSAVDWFDATARPSPARTQR